MNEREKEEIEPTEEAAEEVIEEPQEAKLELPAEFVAPRSTGWDQSSRPGTWTTIGCGLGLVLLIAALFAGSSILKKAVWAGFAGSSRALVANLPGSLPPGERMQLTRNLDRFAVQMRQRDEPYETMGEFQRRVRAALEDHTITRDEVEQINLFLESNLPPSSEHVP